MGRIDITLVDEEPGVGRLGRLREHDSRSRAFAVEAGAEPAAAPPPVLWARHSPILDQGRLGSCTGQAMAGWLGCEPHCTSVADATQYDETMAVGLYELATRLDSIPGYYLPGDPESQDTGSSGLAVAKAAKKTGLISGYGWAFTTWGMIHALRSGGILAGVPWFASMDRPDRDGFITVDPTSRLRGGHEFLIRGWTPPAGRREAYFVCDQSWGPSWADHGTFYLPQSGWETLRSQQADVTVPKV